MNSEELAAAIDYLKPNSQYSFENADYTSIKWDELDGEAPTQIEIDNAVKIIREQKAKLAEQFASKKAAAEAKLAALGLTAEDLKALGL
jgi:hypothetical protein